MAKENQNPQHEKTGGLEDLTKNQYAALAGILWRGDEQERELAKSALEQFAVENGYAEDDGFVQGAVVTDEGTERAINIFSSKYQKAKISTTIGDLMSYYDSILSGYLGENEVKTLRGKLNQYSGKKYGEFVKEFSRAQYIKQGEGKYEFSEDEKKAADETLERYTDVNNILGILEQINLNKLRPKVEDRFNKRLLKGLARKLGSEQEQKS